MKTPKRRGWLRKDALANFAITTIGVLVVCLGFSGFTVLIVLPQMEDGQVVLVNDSPMNRMIARAEERTGLGVVALITPTATVDYTMIDAEPYPPDVITNIRQIYATGQQMGNRPDVFSKVGDSITVAEHFMTPFGMGRYDLGPYAELEPAIVHFSRTDAHQGNSFVNPSQAAGVGWSARSLLDARNADRGFCAAGESPLGCEYRLTRPAIALIMIGTNDVTYLDDAGYRRDLVAVVDATAAAGVIPVVSTIPPLPAHSEKVARFNAVIAEVAAERAIPLMDYHAVMVELPAQGLAPDAIHPSIPPGGLWASADLATQQAYGYVARNQVALEALYRVWAHVRDF